MMSGGEIKTRLCILGRGRMKESSEGKNQDSDVYETREGGWGGNESVPTGCVFGCVDVASPFFFFFSSLFRSESV